MATQWRFGKLRGCICAAAIGALVGCTTSPMTFDFKWFENDPGFTWLLECTGEPPQEGASFSGRIEIVDRRLARRLKRMKSWDELDAEDLKGMRCVSAEEQPRQT